MHRVYCTYCSASKRQDLLPLRALERYDSRRIRQIYGEACSRGVQFLIMSGAFGLLAAHDTIPNYDHLLQHEEVRQMSRRMAQQLREMPVNELIFFTVDPSIDPQVQPYHNSLALACEAAGVLFRVEVLQGDVVD